MKPHQHIRNSMDKSIGRALRHEPKNECHEILWDAFIYIAAQLDLKLEIKDG